MRKGQLFNSDIYQVLSKMGHTDQIAIGDAGLPIPDTTLRTVSYTHLRAHETDQ